MNDLTTKPATPLALAGLNNLAAASATIDIRTGVGQYLKVDQNDGCFIYGAENVEVEEGATWAVNPAEFEKGYIAWASDDCPKNQKPAMPAQHMYNMMAGGAIPLLGDLPATDYPSSWSDQLGMKLVCLNGEDEGTECIFKTNSGGGIEGVGTLIKLVVARLQAGESDLVPIVSMRTSNYTNGRGKVIYKPHFDVKGWTTMEGPADQGQVATDGPGTEKALDVDAIEPEAETEVEEKAPPARRRRRRAS